MFYIPKKWLLKQENMMEVHSVLNKHFHSDLVLEGSDSVKDAVKDLQAIGELIIIEKLKSGEIFTH